MSDSVEELPQGYKAIYEGGNQNRLIKNNKLFIDSGMVDVKYNDTYLLVSVISYQKLRYVIEKESLYELDITQ